MKVYYCFLFDSCFSGNVVLNLERLLSFEFTSHCKDYSDFVEGSAISVIIELEMSCGLFAAAVWKRKSLFLIIVAFVFFY